MEYIAIIVLFIISLSLIYLFFYLHNSQEIREYISKVNSSNTTAGLRLIVFYSVAKLLSIILGLLIPIALIYKIIKGIKNKKPGQ